MMEIDAPLVAKKALPGQFIILRVDEDGERIPLTVAGTDREHGTVKIIFQIVGSTTKKLSFKSEGESITDFVGPLGKPTELDGISRACIVGGGNVAMDAARTALRLGADKVYIVYRRSMDELPARREEVEHAQEEGIELKLLTNPVEILGYNNPDNPRDERNGFVTGMRCVRMRLGEPDERGRRRPEPIPDSEFTLEVDTVVMSIGTTPNPLIKSTTDGLDVNRRGGIITDEHGATSRKGVFAGGDAVTGAATVISAMGAGKTAAAAICEYLDGRRD